MRAARIVAPAALPVSIAEARTRLRLDEATTDQEVTRLLAACTNQVEKVTGRSLVTQQWRAIAPSFASSVNRYSELVLPYPKLISVEQVQYLDTSGNLQNLAPADYEMDNTGIVGCIRPVFNKQWPCTAIYPNAVRVSYTAGYGAPEAVEPDVILAILLLAGHFDLNREATTDRTMAELPMGAQYLLAPYVIPQVC